MIAALIVGAGRGRRMGTDVPKQLLPLCGKPVMSHTLARFQAAGCIDSIALVVPPGDEETTRADIVRRYGLTKVRWIIAGGELRQDSVRAGLVALPDECTVVAIHDAVRPLVEEEMIDACISAAEDCGAAVTAVRARDTIKESDGDGAVVRTLEREPLWTVQTPQCFRLDIIRQAHRLAAEAGFVGTDDAALVERMGASVRLVEGSPHNIKITTPEDLIVAEAILGTDVRGAG